MPRGRGGPLNRRQNRAIWHLFRSLGRIGSRSREEWLTFAGPAMVVSTVGVWVSLLVLGFALIYYPWMETFLVSPGSLRLPWVEALYYSGYTAATLGLGDVVADSHALRILAPVQALGGFALLSVSVTYVLSVYRELIQKQALAARIDSYFGGNEPGTIGAGATDGHASMARLSESISAELAEVLLAHHQYPILHYFRSDTPWRSLPLQLGRLVDLRRRVRAADDAQPITALASHPSYVGLQESLEKYLHEVDDLFVPADGGRADEAGSPDVLDRAHRRLLRYLCYS